MGEIQSFEHKRTCDKQLFSKVSGGGQEWGAGKTTKNIFSWYDKRKPSLTCWK